MPGFPLSFLFWFFPAPAGSCYLKFITKKYIYQNCTHYYSEYPRRLRSRLLGASMVTQRYALSYHSDRVPLCGTHLPRNIVWFIGLVIYGVANGFYAISLMYGPLLLLADVFTTLLVFNMLFARYFLREELTAPRVTGAVLILCGVVLCVSGTPTDVEADFSHEISATPGWGCVCLRAPCRRVEVRSSHQLV